MTFSVFTVITIYGLVVLGVFDKHKILVTTLATTGPDLELLAGHIKLKMQTADLVTHIDLSGVMITDNGWNNLGIYLQNHYLAFGDYFVLKEKVVGVKKSDGLYPHPLIEILSWKQIDKISFWLFVFIDIGLFILSVFFYKRYKTWLKKVC